LIIASEKKTVIRDRCGYLIEHINTLLPNGNPSSTAIGKTMLQGVYSKRDKTLYLTDILMWNDELAIDSTAEIRLMMIMNRLKENPSLSTTLDHTNEVLIKMPQILTCSKTSFDQMYYGLFTTMNAPTFNENYLKLVNYAQTHDLLTQLKIKSEEINTPDGAQKICIAFGYDYLGNPYLKDGIAFIQKEGQYFLGYNAATVQWKDHYSSPYYDALLQTPMIAYLYYDKSRKLQTHDGYIIDKTDPVIDTLKPDQTIMCTFNGIYLKDPYATLDGLKYYKPINKIVWSSMNNLVFKLLCKTQMLSYTILSSQIANQEFSLKSIGN